MMTRCGCLIKEDLWSKEETEKKPPQPENEGGTQAGKMFCLGLVIQQVICGEESGALDSLLVVSPPSLLKI